MTGWCFESHIRNEVQSITLFIAKMLGYTGVEFINIMILSMKKWNAKFPTVFLRQMCIWVPTWGGVVGRKSRDERAIILSFTIKFNHLI